MKRKYHIFRFLFACVVEFDDLKEMHSKVSNSICFPLEAQSHRHTFIGAKFWDFLQVLTFLIKMHFISSHPEVFLEKDVLKICSKFTEEHPCWSLKLQTNFIEMLLSHVCSPVIYCMFSEHLFIRTPMDGCFWHLVGSSF